MKTLVAKLIRDGYLKTPQIIEAFLAVDRADFVLPEYKSEAYGDYPLPIGYGQTISQPATVAFMLELLQPQAGDKVMDAGSGSGWQTAILAEIVGEKGSHDSAKAVIRRLLRSLRSRVVVIRRLLRSLRSRVVVIRRLLRSLRSRVASLDCVLCANRKAFGQNGSVYAVERIPELCEFGQKNLQKYNLKNIFYFCADVTKGLSEYAPFDKIIAAASGEVMSPAWLEQLKIGGRIVAPIQSSIWLYIKKSETEFEKYEYPGFVFVPLVKD